MTATRSPRDPAPTAQEIRFLRAGDGVRLAYAVHGEGPPLANVACWLSHLQFDWESPVWRHLPEDLGSLTTLVRYDERGTGLCESELADYSPDARPNDTEPV